MLDRGVPGPGAKPGSIVPGEFLEGFDLAGEEGFEDWLREQRGRLEAGAGARTAPAASAGAGAGTSAGTGPGALTAAPSPTVEPAPASFVDRPALAILPFANLSGDAAHDYLCEGLSEDLIDRLSRLRWLPVIARSSSFAFASDRVDLRVIGQKLRAKYVLEGRLKRASDGLSVAVSLSDAATGYLLWSHRVALPPERSQDALDPIVAELVGVLDAQIDYAEQVRARGNRQNRLEYNDLIWRGRWHLNRLTRADSEIARRLFDQALELEPESPEAIIQQSFALGWSLWARRGGAAEIAEMRQLAHRAIVADPDDGRGHMQAGIAEMWLRRSSRARTLFERAIELNPSLCMAHAQLGGHYNLMGEPAAAIEPLRMAQRLSPNDVHSFYFLNEFAVAHWMLGNWAEAAGHADQSLIRRPAYWYALVIKINALVGSGDPDAARRAYGELMTVKPDFTPQFIDWIPFVDGAWNRRMADGLAVATGEQKTGEQKTARRRR
jgi:TolB-like protein/Flp pilus assembly protein TadD